LNPPEHMGHRRAHLRFEVVGAMSASLLSTETLQVINLGASGALVEGSLPLPSNAEYRMQLVLESHVSEVIAKVRRVMAVARDLEAVRYRIGLEFLSISPEAKDVINQIVSANQAQV
jgi:c-di-GMP-binding flagellar brake protein YcgR